MRNRLLWIILGLLVVGIVLHYVLGLRMAREDIHISAAAEPLACIGGAPVGGVGSREMWGAKGAEGAAAAPAAGGSRSIFGGRPGHWGAGIVLIPYRRAPAADLNVTFAFALTAVFMVEFFGVQALGLS